MRLLSCLVVVVVTVLPCSVIALWTAVAHMQTEHPDTDLTSAKPASLLVHQKTLRGQTGLLTSNVCVFRSKTFWLQHTLIKINHKYMRAHAGNCRGQDRGVHQK